MNNWDPFEWLSTAHKISSAWQSSFPSDVIDQGEKLKIIVDMPGVELEDVSLDVNRSQITINAFRKCPEREGVEWRKFSFMGRTCGEIRSSFNVGAELDPSNTKAVLKDGVLTISAAKLPRSSKTSPVLIVKN